MRLVQGQAGSETEYGSALDAALTWQRDGAEWIHLVDLDAAFGRGSNRELLAEVVGKLDVAVELSGGIRDDESLTAALATGCARVNLGTAALENPQWCARVVAEHGEKVAVGLDVKIVDGQHRLRGRGWETDGGDLWEVLERLDREGCSRFVVTDVTKDGTLNGPNLELLAQGHRAHRRPGDRLRRRVQPRRPARDRHADRPRRRGRDRRKGVVRRAIHAAAGAGRGGAVGPSMALDETDLDALVAEAAAILDAAAKPFIEGHRADSAVQKKGNDFATEVDLAIERQVVEALTRETGIEVHGEEFGGADVDSPLVWVLDPIDGTFNYAAGSPMAAILLGLLRDGEPVAGLTWLPFTGERFTGVVGKPLRSNGVEQPSLAARGRWPTPSSGSAPSTSTPAAGCRAATGSRCSRT